MRISPELARKAYRLGGRLMLPFGLATLFLGLTSVEAGEWGAGLCYLVFAGWSLFEYYRFTYRSDSTPQK